MINFSLFRHKSKMEKAIIDMLKIQKNPIRTPDLRKSIRQKHKGFKFTKKELNQTLYKLLDQNKIERCVKIRPNDAPRWKLHIEKIRYIIK